jgi:hypothetical protein
MLSTMATVLALNAPLRGVRVHGVRVQMSAADRTFTRAGDFLGSGVSVTAAEVVNVLGRWRNHREWDTIGVLAEMDQLFDDDGQITDGPALQRAWARWDAAYITGENLATERKMLQVKGLPDYRAANLPVWMASGSGAMPKRDPAFGDYKGRANERLSGPQPDAARSAARRGFCKRKKQAQVASSHPNSSHRIPSQRVSSRLISSHPASSAALVAQ